MARQLFVPEDLQGVLPDVERLFALYREHLALPEYEHLELELRLGTTRGRKFESGVTKKVWTQMLETCHGSACWGDKDDEWVHLHDFFYDVDGTPVRTTYNVGGDVVHITKTHIRKLTLATTQGAVRLALAHETPVDDLPTTVTPRHVRIKRRLTLQYGPWSYMFSQVWAGDTREEAEQAQQRGQCSYEVEIELSPDRQYVGERQNSHLAMSMLLKARDLVGVGQWSVF